MAWVILKGMVLILLTILAAACAGCLLGDILEALGVFGPEPW